MAQSSRRCENEQLFGKEVFIGADSVSALYQTRGEKRSTVKHQQVTLYKYENSFKSSVFLMVRQY